MIKRLTAFLLSAFIVFSFLSFSQQQVFASTFSAENTELSFQFPDNETMIPVLNNENYKSYTDTDSSSVSVIISDIYYEVTDNGDEKLVEQYPKESVWIGCGLFEDTWNNQDYVYNYLLSAINQSTVQYTGAIDRIELQGLPYYRFSYFEESGNTEKPGGVIYLTLYHAKLYTVYFSNFYRYSVSANYGSVFESSVRMSGIDQFVFPVFKTENSDGLYYYVAAGAAVFLVLTAVAFLIKRRKKKRILKRETGGQ
ncbi:MAG: hypothetical protein ACC608_04120 [Anaerofustis sp.]